MSKPSAPQFTVTVDLVGLAIRENTLHVLLVDRTEEPFAGSRSLPGGTLLPDEDLDDAAARVLTETTGRRLIRHLEQLATFASPDRDPRGQTVSVTYLALAPTGPDPRPADDPPGTTWVPVDQAVESGLAFDHAAILTEGVARAQARLEYTSLGTVFCPAEFTISNLREVYEAVWGTELDPRNFHRKVTKTTGFLIETGYSASNGLGRPAATFRRGKTTTLIPPLNREPQPPSPSGKHLMFG